MSSSLGHVWFSSATARLARLGRPRGAEIKQRPCTVRVGDGYKVGHCRGEVLITLVSVLAVVPLAVTHMVVYIYNNNRFNLPSDPVPLMGPRKLIPIGKAHITLRKPIFWVNKNLQGNVRGNTSR